MAVSIKNLGEFDLLNVENIGLNLVGKITYNLFGFDGSLWFFRLKIFKEKSLPLL